jgi:hypothetical protein
MGRNPAKIDHPETASALNLRSHSIDKLNHPGALATLKLRRRYHNNNTPQQQPAAPAPLNLNPS